MKIIGIIGTRKRDSFVDQVAVEAVFLKHYNQGDEIVSGGCSAGGDRFAEALAKKYQVPIKIYYAPWRVMGKKAGFYRNTWIINDASILIACVGKDRVGGTEDSIKKFEALGKSAIIVL